MECGHCGRHSSIIYVNAEGTLCPKCEDERRSGLSEWEVIQKRNRRWLNGEKKEVVDE